MNQERVLPILWCSILLAFGCSKQPAENQLNVSETVTNYPVRGIVRELPADGKKVIIKHEDVPGYMPAMTMPFPVRDPAHLQGVKIGDTVRFRLRVTSTDGWIDEIHVEPPDASSKPDANPLTAVNVLPNVPELKPGDPLPDYVFTNQLGQPFHLHDFKGQALAITFIFTRCPFPDFCPRMTDRFRGTYKLLKEGGTPDNWKLLSLSFDPQFDTPQVLKEYAEIQNIDLGRWWLASGSFEQIDPLAGHFGLYFGRNLPPAAQNHVLRTVVIDARSRVQRIFIGNEWTSLELAGELRKAASPPR
ncbi:MAG: hypothetical protein EXS36_14410 [Pedosphaera sp.]|nr:hypothetical protein [Pedosphaera sp.]